MTYRALLPLALLLAACSSEIAPTAAETPTQAPLTFMAPDGSDADYDSPVAPYVLARGAGPSALSPDGSVIATRLSLTGDRQLYVMDATADDPQSTLTQITFGSGITFFDFSPTGALIYGSDNNGDERENYWLIAQVDGAWGEPRLILPATEQGFRQFGDFTGDGATIVYSSTERNGADFDIYKADVSTGAATLVYEGVLGNYVQASAGAGIVYSKAVGEDSDTLHLLKHSGVSLALSIPNPRANHTDAGVHVTAEKDILVFASNKGREFSALSQMHLYPEYNIDGVVRTVYETDADIDDIAICQNNSLFTVNRDGFSELFLHSGDEMPIQIKGLPRGVYDIDCAVHSGLVRVTASNVSGDLYLVDLNTLTPRRVFASDYEGLDPASLVMPESIRLPASDGVEVQGLLYLPQNTTAKPPVVFMVHGGPTAQARPSWNGTVQYLLSRGIAVFQPNVRGSTGFGRTYVTLDDQKKRLDSVRDLVDMLAYLEADGRVDSSRAAVMGGSYGGYMVNAVLADYPDAFDAGVALFGVGDWVTALEVASPGLKASDIIEYGDISDPAWREFYTQISPIAKADNIRVPVLYSHGAMDPRIDVAETEIMVRALRGNGVRADYVLIPDEGHGWRKISNRLYYEGVQAAFLEDVFSQ